MNTINTIKKQTKNNKSDSIDSIKQTQLKINEYYRTKFGKNNEQITHPYAVAILPTISEVDDFTSLLNDFSNPIFG